MRPSIALARHRDAVLAAVARRRVVNPRVFGSVARGEDTDTSDLDLLVDKLPETSFSDLMGLEEELGALLGVRVDVGTSNVLHWVIRDQVLAEARPV